MFAAIYYGACTVGLQHQSFLIRQVKADL
jgi:hypothetical protein